VGRRRALVERSRFRIPGYPLVAETSVAHFSASAKSPLGVKYRLQLYHEETGETLVRYDIHHGKGHHRHFGNVETPYNWHGVAELLEDFRRDIERVKRLLREETG
jgi:Family of unknown function (DUF6516)